MDETMQDALFGLMESESELKYYLKKTGHLGYADKPAVIVATGMWLAPDHKKGEWYTVYFGTGIEHWNVKTIKQAKEKVAEILGHYPNPVKMVDKFGKSHLTRFVSQKHSSVQNHEAEK